MNKFIQYSFLVIFFGSITYLVLEFQSIDPQYKKEVAVILKERRERIEAKCKYILKMDERFDCYNQSAINLRSLITNKDVIINAHNMYKSLLNLNLNDQVLNSIEYKDFEAKMLKSLDEIYRDIAQ